LSAPEVRVVAAWHEALNAGDVDRLSDFSHPDVEVGGPHGTGRGAQLLRDWALRSGIRLLPTRVFHDEVRVVVEQEAEWNPAEAGEASSRQTLASVFVVRDSLVTSVSRHPDLAEALLVADLGAQHEVTADHRAGARGSGGEVGSL
jgi:hypothetical protein